MYTLVAVGFTEIDEEKLILENNDDFYFVHLTDTHIKHKIFDINENTKERLSKVINHVISFEKKPSFIVITGDLTEWGGNRITGALNCVAFSNCFLVLIRLIILGSITIKLISIKSDNSVCIVYQRTNLLSNTFDY